MSTLESLGKIFQKKRQDMEVSFEEISGRTYISIAVLKDIESGVFDKISPVYMKSFVKKYSDFLGLDTLDILKQFENIEEAAPKKEFSVSKKEETRKPKTRTAQAKVKVNEVLPYDKKVQVIIGVVLGAVLIALVFVLVNVTVSVVKSPPRESPVVLPSRTFPLVPSLSDMSGDKIPVEVTASDKVVLTLHARDRVWLKLTSAEEDEIFDGFINKGDSRTWEFQGKVTIWTGKANVLDFNVNGRDLGVVASGVVKNINVSSEGVAVGDKWVARLP